MGNLEDAGNCYRKALILNPDYPDAHYNLGVALQDEGKLEEAVLSYQKALELKPKYPEAHNNLGNSFRDLEMSEKAVNSYSKALELEPNYVEALYNLGYLFHKLGRLGEAVDILKKSIAVKPDSPNAKHVLDSLLGNKTDCAPTEYVEDLHNSFAKTFDNQLVNQLKYNVPTLLKEALQDLGWGNKKFRNVIDLGCGTGLSGAEFRDLAEILIGIDLSRNMISEAKKKNIYDELYVDQISHRLDTLNIKADLFISSDVFIYIGNLLPLFQSIREHSNKNCVFVFSTEHANEGEYILRNTCRYAHSKDYVLSVASRCGYRIQFFKEDNLRTEGGSWVTGGIYVLKYK